MSDPSMRAMTQPDVALATDTISRCGSTVSLPVAASGRAPAWVSAELCTLHIFSSKSCSAHPAGTDESPSKIARAARVSTYITFDARPRWIVPYGRPNTSSIASKVSSTSSPRMCWNESTKLERIARKASRASFCISS